MSSSKRKSELGARSRSVPQADSSRPIRRAGHRARCQIRSLFLGLAAATLVASAGANEPERGDEYESPDVVSATPDEAQAAPNLESTPPSDEEPNDDTPATSDDEAEAQQYQWAQNPEVAASVDEVLSERRFQFCHQPGYRLWPAQKKYCAFAEDLSERCPELAAACQRPAWGEQEELDGDVSFDLPRLGALAGVARVLFWMGVAAVVLLLVRALAAHAIAEARRRRGRSKVEPVLITSESAPSLPRETDVDRLLARARAEAEQGNYEAAVASAYAASLRSLDDRGLIQVHPSRTNGDYLRQLAASHDERNQMRSIVREVEDIQFGSGAIDRGRFERILGRAVELSGRAAALLLIVLASGISSGCSRTTGPESPNSPTGPNGFALFETLLERHSLGVTRRVRRLTEIPADVSTIVALEPDLRQTEWQRVADWVHSGGVLFTAGVPPELAGPLGLEFELVECEGELASPPLELRIPPTKAFDGGATNAVVTCNEHPFLLELSHGDGWVYALPNADWLENATLAIADNAQIVMQLAGDAAGKVEFLGPWTGTGTRHPLESVQNSGLGPWLLQLLLLAALYALSRGRRFQTPVEPSRQKRRAFSEHAEALGAQYARARASGYALEQYGRWAADRLRERVPTREKDMHSLAQAVARRTGREPMAILKVLVEAQSASQVPSDVQSHARVMQDLVSLLHEVGGLRETGGESTEPEAKPR